MNEQSLIVADKPISVLANYSIPPIALQLRDEALSNSALIGKVETKEQNEVAVAAQIKLDRIAKDWRKAREQENQQYLQASRNLMKAVESQLLDVDKEIGRIAELRAQFKRAEDDRIREEQELQRRELARIEAERQAELQRIAREAAAAAAEVARVAREQAQREAADREQVARLAAEANSVVERKRAAEFLEEVNRAAEANRVENERKAAQAKEAAITQTQLVIERADAAAFAENKPIVATRAAGESNRTDWDIVIINPYELAKFHPDCVKIEPLLTPIKQALNMGITVKGVRAEKKITAGVRQSGKARFTDI